MRSTIKRKLCLFGLICSTSIFTVFFLIDFLGQVVVETENAKETANRVYGDPQTRKNNPSQCILPNLDPWDPLIRAEMQDPGPVDSNCQPTIDRLTTLENGLLKVEEGLWFEPKCQYRCLYPVNDRTMEVDPWKEVDAKIGNYPKCDIVEVNCQRSLHSNYSFVHTQIVEKPEPEPQDKSTKQSEYNFYWIVVDSTSMSMFKRAMRQTTKVLKQKFDAIEFPYLNKIGMNSRANSYGMFFGICAKNNTMETKLCNTPLDDMPYVGFDFQSNGYYTHESEDFWTGTLDWPNCVGFRRNHADHFMRPFWLTVGWSSYANIALSPETREQMWAESCKTNHNYVLEHLLQFAGSYNGKPKFSMEWMVDLAHDENPNLFGADPEFARFFEQLHEKAQNSFIFFQADHGMRWKNVRNIPVIGEIEDSNPFLYVIVPEKLRKNPTLMKSLQENSRHLVSHMDLYASAVQVANFAHDWSETTDFNRPMLPLPNRSFLGSSLFHRMRQPRTCEILGIPSEYCMCSKELLELNDESLGRRVAQKLVDYLNQDLKDFGFEKPCQKHLLNAEYPIQLEEFQHKSGSGMRTFRAKFKTLPGQALYQGVVKMFANKTLSLMYANFPRLNSYAKQAQCIPEQFMRNYCVCY